ncbi:branched-chain amino acid ABC transporter permease [Oceanicella actignis]|uniref:branched-chain amino acid ABC transporter permease n=1 Tax=Oceanicella actignis TaxID=1189325 RepID=UPI0011E87771|nr:amino acid/amide ABC transporter membrane protein 2 (HAAT family) [Oceanicella actignis]
MAGNGLGRGLAAFGAMAALLIAVGYAQSWSVSLAMLNLCLISAIMALGLNIQWGYAGLFNAGVMGFVALGGLAAVLVSEPFRPEAWRAGGAGLGAAAASALAAAALIAAIRRRMRPGLARGALTAILAMGGYALARHFFDPAVEAIEAIDPSSAGNIGGLGLPIILSWPVGGLFAAAAAWLVGKIALGLRSDYLAIATLGISEIIIAIIKNEDWLARGVKNVSGLSRPVPYELELQQSAWFVAKAQSWGLDPAEASGLAVKAMYAGLFAAVLLAILWLAERALRSPWGRMMRAIRDNEHAAAAMGKDVTARHLQVFVLGSAVIGMAGAMLTTLDGQFTPGTYNPLRYTFLIWVMVIVGGSGNNWGAVLGGFLIWFVWVQAEPAGLMLAETVGALLPEGSPLAQALSEGAPHMRMIFMGLILLLVLRFAPRGILPEKIRR